MARMHPPVPAEDTPASERKFFEKLRDKLPSDWTVLHSRRIVFPQGKGKRAFEGESDFVLIDPGRGILVLEVKGGIEVGNGPDGWYSIDHEGRRHNIKDPGKQVRGVMDQILQILRDKPGWPVPREERRLAWGVGFPGFKIGGEMGPDLPRDFVIDSSDLENIRESVDRLFDGHRVTRGPMPHGTGRFVVEALGPVFRFVRPLASRIDEQEDVLLQLTEDQYRILDAASDNPRVEVKGGAGSGKTLVAMELARRLAKEGKRTLFLCFNSPLAKHLARNSDTFEVCTFHKKCEDLIRGAQLEGRTPPARDEPFWLEDAPTRMLEALDRLPDERWDAVLVDEGQDFRELWWIAVEKLLHNSKSSLLYVFWDPGQDLYGGGPVQSSKPTQLRLRHNCRNTRRIGEYASKLIDQLPSPHPQVPEGDTVEQIRVPDGAAMCEAVRKVLHRLLKDEKVATKRVIILSTVSRERSPVLRPGKIGPYSLVDTEVAEPGPSQVRFSTIHRYKGLESDVVILCDVKHGEEWSRPELLHVGATRAKHYLVEISYDTQGS